MYLFNVLICLFAVGNIQTSAQQQPGDSCTANGKSGICQPLSSCPSAVAALKGGQQLVHCGLSAQTPVVCCVELEVTTPKSTTTTTPNPALIGNKAYEKCVEYSQYIYEWTYPPVGASDSSKIKINRCAQVAAELVVGGENAKAREFGHMAALGYIVNDKLAWSCGGSLVSDQYILTAAHCLNTLNGELKRVRVGDLNLEGSDDTAAPQEFDIEEKIPHPDYKPPSRYNDIALLKVAGKVILTSFTVPACLRWDPVVSEKYALATGWGLTTFNGANSAALQKVKLELFDINECQNSYQNISKRRLSSGILPKTQLCAGHHTLKRDTCHGDSGGPLQVFQKDGIYCMYSIIGITSFGTSCGDTADAPGVYTRVEPYLTWIEKIIWT